MCRRPPRQAAGASPARLGGTGHACPRRLPEHTPRFAEAQELHRSPPGPDGTPAVGARTDALKPAANTPACGGRRRETTHRLEFLASLPVGSKRSSSPFVSSPHHHSGPRATDSCRASAPNPFDLFQRIARKPLFFTRTSA